jgi:hypothetical protein
MPHPPFAFHWYIFSFGSDVTSTRAGWRGVTEYAVFGLVRRSAPHQIPPVEMSDWLFPGNRHLRVRIYSAEIGVAPGQAMGRAGL